MYRKETYDNKGKIVDLVERPFTPDEVMNIWKAEMAATDNPQTGMSQDRFWHIKEDHDGVTGNPDSQTRYDAKKAVHDSKPAE